MARPSITSRHFPAWWTYGRFWDSGRRASTKMRFRVAGFGRNVA